MSNAATSKVTVDLEVPFYDVDALGIVWHGHYYKYLEIARTALLRQRGLDVGDPALSRYRFLVIESRCRYLSPLRYSDRLRVAAWFRDVQHRITIAYEITNLSEDRRAAKGQTILATTDSSGRLLLETPREIRERLAG